MPSHIIVALATIVGAGNGLTVTVTSSVLVQEPIVPVTVYVVVVVGFAVTLAVVVPLNPVDGLHTNVAFPAEVAVNVVLAPSQITTSAPAFVVGAALNVIVAESEDVPQMFVAMYFTKTLPAVISAVEGVYETVVFVTFGVNTPVPLVVQDPNCAS